MSGWRLDGLLEGVVEAERLADPGIAAVTVGGLACDSRQVAPGDLFIARGGRHHHGSRFIGDALARGAAAVLYEPEGALPLPTVEAGGAPLLAVPGLARQMGRVADRFHGQLSRALFTVAITGTNGKTTTSWLTAHALHAGGRRCGLIGTLGNGLADAVVQGDHTTPHSCEIHRLMARFRDQGARAMVMEASSHGIHQGRLNHLDLDVAVFTNLTRDHLDYHGSMEHYGETKRRLFRHPELRAAVVNADDPEGREILATLPAGTLAWAYALDPEVAVERPGGALHWVRARRVAATAGGLTVEVATPHGEGRIDSPMLGRFNAANLLAALAVLELAGLSTEEACRRLGEVPPVPGRMGRIEVAGGAGGRPTVVVDYAHTPDALEKALAALRPHCEGRLICVFGCGGGRDAGKRPQMGAVAAGLADQVWLTDDNPRHEDGAAIVAAIRDGMPAGFEPQVERDRAAAIAAAVAEAGPGDVVLVAGKGHEEYQQIGDERRYFNDTEEARGALARWGVDDGRGAA
ncbi:UDP-N-acetylmuramoyl-L-alanyl-D-glutamate--2,6-diaminopimelate ligase [Endothiovibrio diazotrophicus]